LRFSGWPLSLSSGSSSCAGGETASPAALTLTRRHRVRAGERRKPPLFQVATVRDGRLAHLQVYRMRKQALKAARAVA
jgi:hypothetical protein